MASRVDILPPDCEHCGAMRGHAGMCPRVKAIEYYEDGKVKRVEYHPIGEISAVGYPPFDVEGVSVTADPATLHSFAEGE